MKLFMLLLLAVLITACGSKKNIQTVDKSVSRPVKSAKAKGMIVLYQDGSNHIFSYKIEKDKKNSVLTLKTQFGFTAAEVYVKSDSVWVLIPSEKVAYFQDKSNILLVPNLKTNDIPIGMLMDYLVGNFSFKYSILNNEYDLPLVESMRTVQYGYIDGELAAVMYQIGEVKMNTSIKHMGNKIKLNLKRMSNVLMTINIENIVLQADKDPNIFIPSIPEDYQLVNL